MQRGKKNNKPASGPISNQNGDLDLRDLHSPIYLTFNNLKFWEIVLSLGNYFWSIRGKKMEWPPQIGMIFFFL